MAEPALLFEISDLEIALKVPTGTLDEDPYTLLCARQASEKVRSVAEQPTWVSPEKDPLETGETHAPWRASDIAVRLAKQVWEDRGNLQRRTAGPISSTYFEGGLRGLDLAPDDRQWLEGQRTGGTTNGFWMMRHYGTTARTTRRAETPDGYSFSAGDMNFSHGMDMRGSADADSW